MDPDLVAVIFLLIIVGIWCLGWLVGKMPVRSVGWAIAAALSGVLGLLTIELIIKGLWIYYHK